MGNSDPACRVAWQKVIIIKPLAHDHTDNKRQIKILISEISDYKPGSGFPLDSEKPFHGGAVQAAVALLMVC